MNIGRFLSDEGGNTDGGLVFNIAIATIFAREFLEAVVIIGQYRTVIQRSDHWDDDTRAKALSAVTKSAIFASSLAILVVIAVAIPLGVLSKKLDEHTVNIIEGTSKVIASVFIVQLSVKIPVWLGLYEKVSIFPWKNKDLATSEDMAKQIDTLSFNELRFNVAWNIWREVAECGVFLIPFILGSGAEAIPVSGVVGIGVAMVLGLAIYIANHRLTNIFWLAFFMSGLTLMLAVGLFVGGCHEFEEYAGETKVVWEAENEGFSDNRFPFVILNPFGYSSERTVLEMVTFWLFLALGLTYHFLKWNATKAVRLARGEAMANHRPEESPAQVVLEGDDDLEKGADRTKELSSSDGSSEKC